MTERMSDDKYRTRVLWLSCNVELDDGQAKSIADDWQRARAEEERLGKRVAELESELSIKTNECKLIHERGMEAIRELNRGLDDDDRIRRIVREEMRKAQLDVTAKHGYEALGSMRIVEQPFAGAMWPDEEETNG